MEAWVDRETQVPQGVPSKAAAGFQELLGGGTECKYVQEMGEAMVINHSFTGKQPKQRKGEQRGCAILASTAQ